MGIHPSGGGAGQAAKRYRYVDLQSQQRAIVGTEVQSVPPHSSLRPSGSGTSHLTAVHWALTSLNERARTRGPMWMRTVGHEVASDRRYIPTNPFTRIIPTGPAHKRSYLANTPLNAVFSWPWRAHGVLSVHYTVDSSLLSLLSACTTSLPMTRAL